MAQVDLRLKASTSQGPSFTVSVPCSSALRKFLHQENKRQGNIEKLLTSCDFSKDNPLADIWECTLACSID